MSAAYTARRIVWSSRSLVPMALVMIAAGFDFYVLVSSLLRGITMRWGVLRKRGRGLLRGPAQDCLKEALAVP